MIAAGHVTVAGEVVTDPARDVGRRSGVAVDGEAVRPEPREVWAVNKPLDVVSTAREPGSRRAVTELVRSERRLYPVGRLDADSTGLILLTNDGELANRLTHPRYGVARTYRATLRGAPSARDLDRLRRGVELDDGPTQPAKVRRAGEARDRDHDPRGTKPPGAADGGGDPERGGRPAARGLRLAAPGAAGRRRGPAAARARGGAALEGCRVPVSDFVAKAAGKAAGRPPGV